MQTQETSVGAGGLLCISGGLLMLRVERPPPPGSPPASPGPTPPSCSCERGLGVPLPEDGILGTETYGGSRETAWGQAVTGPRVAPSRPGVETPWAAGRPRRKLSPSKALPEHSTRSTTPV